MRALRELTEAVIAMSICIAIGSSTAQAHPHAWIDLRSTVVLDDAGRITAIEQQWLFDPLYTVFATDELTTKTSNPRRSNGEHWPLETFENCTAMTISPWCAWVMQRPHSTR